MKKTTMTILTLTLWANTPLFAENNHQHGNDHDDMATHEMGKHNMDMDEHDDHGEDDDHEKGDSHGGDEHSEEGGAPIKLTPAQIKQAGIQTIIVQPQVRKQSIQAPGTVSFNAYKLSDVTALVDGVVEHRFVRLGDAVQRGQRLLTLTSSALAQAQADYLRAEGEHRTAKLGIQRLQGLVKDKIVSQARFQQAQSNEQAAKANLAAAKASLSSYGMRNQDIHALMESNEYGKLTLRAPIAGTVAADDFRLGQHIAAGSRLLKIVDESTVWVEVKLAQSQVAGIHAGESAVIISKANHATYPATVLNVYHQLDNTTRTVGVRLEVDNPEDALHPGMFVTAEIATGHGDKALLLPAQAVQRQGSELIVFIEEEAGHFERREVEVGKTSLGLTPIVKGIQKGETVVVKGAFILASELAKSGFAVHNH